MNFWTYRYQEGDIEAGVSPEQALRFRLLSSQVWSSQRWLVDMESREGKQENLLYIR